MATIFRPPLIEPPRRVRPTPVYHDPPNLIIATLGTDKFFGAAGQPPFFVEWPNPRRARPNPNTTELVSPSLLGKDKFFGAAGQPPFFQDFPNPRRVRPNPNTTELQSFSLLGQDQFYGAPGQGISHDTTPPPRRPRRSIDFMTELQSLLLLGKDQFFGAAGQPPFFVEWPNPRRLRPLPIWTDLNNYTIRLPIAALPPISNEMWPPPPRRVRPGFGHIEPVPLVMLNPDPITGGAVLDGDERFLQKNDVGKKISIATGMDLTGLAYTDLTFTVQRPDGTLVVLAGYRTITDLQAGLVYVRTSSGDLNQVGQYFIQVTMLSGAFAVATDIMDFWVDDVL